MTAQSSVQAVLFRRLSSGSVKTYIFLVVCLSVLTHAVLACTLPT